ncbi:flavodoxin [Candidatus Curculioniphilus buchneri]|uniref:flavodoxin n=1 Tax=Candidatus Curculioniphilus buchneri TaxID=690594 RepID=UPI00376F063C
MAKVGIFVGTVYGNSLFVAEEVKLVLMTQGHQVVIFEDGNFEQWKIYSNRVILIITSTTGQGSLPNNIIPLFQQIKNTLERQILLRYGIIALGDKNYDTFCNAGHIFDVLLQKKDATRVGNLIKIDTLEHPDSSAIACSWARKWNVLL